MGRSQRRRRRRRRVPAPAPRAASFGAARNRTAAPARWPPTLFRQPHDELRTAPARSRRLPIRLPSASSTSSSPTIPTSEQSSSTASPVSKEPPSASLPGTRAQGRQEGLRARPAVAPQEQARRCRQGFREGHRRLLQVRDDAWVNLGQAASPTTVHRTRPRRASLKAIEADPKLVTPYVELGLLAAKDANWQDSVSFPRPRRRAARSRRLPAVLVCRRRRQLQPQAVRRRRESRTQLPSSSTRATPTPAPAIFSASSSLRSTTTPLPSPNSSNSVKLAPNTPDVAQVKDQLAQYEKLAGSK